MNKSTYRGKDKLGETSMMGNVVYENVALSGPLFIWTSREAQLMSMNMGKGLNKVIFKLPINYFLCGKPFN